VSPTSCSNGKVVTKKVQHILRKNEENFSKHIQLMWRVCDIFSGGILAQAVFGVVHRPRRQNRGHESIDFKQFYNLNTDRVVIFPHRQQSSSKNSVILENKVGSFNGLELMYNRFNIQQQNVNPKKLYFCTL